MVQRCPEPKGPLSLSNLLYSSYRTASNTKPKAGVGRCVCTQEEIGENQTWVVPPKKHCWETECRTRSVFPSPLCEGRDGREKQAAEIGLVAAPSSAACRLACRVIAATSVTVKNAKEFLCHFQSLNLPKFPSLELKFCSPGQLPKRKKKCYSKNVAKVT